MFDFLSVFLHFREPADILAAYHRKSERHRKLTGESCLIPREHCVQPDGTITSTSVIDPVVIARWRRRSDGGYRIELVR